MVYSADGTVRYLINREPVKATFLDSNRGIMSVYISSKKTTIAVPLREAWLEYKDHPLDSINASILGLDIKNDVIILMSKFYIERKSSSLRGCASIPRVLSA